MSSIADLLGRFVWHDLMTTDVEAATSFYTALFPDWRINIVPMEGGYDYHMIGAGGTNVGGMLLLDEALGFPSHWISYVAVEDCDATVARLEDRKSTRLNSSHVVTSDAAFCLKKKHNIYNLNHTVFPRLP